MPPNQKDVIKTLRSLLNSTKDGLTERQLWRDFKEMEGYPVPFRELGFRTFIEFLEVSNEFELIRTSEGNHIRARLTAESIHIAALVSSQNRSKRRKSTKPAAFIPRSNIQLDNNNWNHTANSKVQSQPQNRPQYQPQQRAQPQSQLRAPLRPPPQLHKPQLQPQKRFEALPAPQVQFSSPARNLSQQQTVQPQPIPYIKPANTYQNHVPPATLTEVVNLTKPVETVPTPSKSVSPVADAWKHDLWDPTPSVKNTNNNQPNPVKQSYPVSESRPVPLVPKTNSEYPYIRRMMNQQNVNVQPKAEPKKNEISKLWLSGSVEPKRKSAFERLGKKVDDSTEEPPSSVQSRLLVNRSPEPGAKHVDTVDFITTKPKLIRSTNDIDAIAKKITETFLDGLDEKNPKAALMLVCKQRLYEMPQYDTVQSHFKKYEGLVRVEGMTYSTHPFDYAKVCEAEEAAARIALSNIKDRPVSQESTDQIAQKIFDCIADNGVFLKYLPNIFEQKYETALPTDWENIIQKRPEMFTIDTQRTNYDIIFKEMAKPQVQPVPEQARASAPGPAQRSMIQSVDTVPQRDESFEMNTMKLPWFDVTWKIDVTWVASTIDVWGQLSDSESMDDLNRELEKIEENFSRGIYPEPCENVIVGGIYLVSAHEITEDSTRPTLTVYRIKVKKIDDDKKLALCFYIDDGFEEWISLVDSNDLKLYQISRELLKIPPQAIHFSLFNLEDFAENGLAQSEAAQSLSNRQFLAKIKSTKEQYEKQLMANGVAKVNVMLFDMSKEENVNMNKEILGNICSKLRPPQLEQNQSTVVHVTHVSDIGEIHCRHHNSKEMHHIKQLINRLTQNGINEAYRLDAGDLNDVTSKALRLVYDSTDKRWCRAMVLPSQMPRRNMARCQFVDYGHIKFVEHEHMYKLERLSTALSKYPPQSIVVRLNGFQPNDYTTNIIRRLRELLCCQKTVLIKSIDQSDIIAVDIWKHVGSLLCKINDAIRMEISEMVPLPDLDDSFSSDEKEETNDTDLPLHPKPNCNQIYRAEVVTALNPSYFFVRLAVNKPEYERMMHSLWKVCEKSDQILSKADIKLNHFYAGRLGDGYWHRVKIQGISNELVVVQMWDSGNIAQISIDALRPLPSAYHRNPQMVFPARLGDIQPLQKVWNKDDCAHFIELTADKTFMIEIKRIQMEMDNRQKYVAELALISPEKNTNISKQLVEELRAQFAP